MSFDNQNPQDNLVTDLNRSVGEVLDSINQLTNSFDEIVSTVDNFRNSSGIKDELFIREIRQTQQNLVEFRQKMEKLSSEHQAFAADQEIFSDKIDSLLPNTLEILSRLDLLSRDVMKYMMDLSEKGWEKYQVAGDGITTSLGEIKHIYQELLNRSNDPVKPNQILIDYLQRIDNLIKSCDQSLHIIKSSLPQDLEAYLMQHAEKSEMSFRNIEKMLEVLLQAHYKDHYKDEKGETLDAVSMFKSWISNSFFSLFSKYLFYIIMFLLGGWFFKGEQVNPFEHIKQPPAQVQQQTPVDKK